MSENFKSKLIVEQHFHGAMGVDFTCCSVADVIELSRKLLKRGIGGFFPTLVTDEISNIKRQIKIFKDVMKYQTSDMAEMLGVHIEGLFLNPEKNGIHDITQFIDVSIQNFQKIDDEIIKIVTLAPELDKNFELSKYLKSRGIKVQAGHCVGADLSECTGVTHLFNAMSGINHRTHSTVLSALINDDLYTEIIADGVHFNDDTLNLILKTKPENKVILISDCLPITDSKLKEMQFCNKTIYYNGEQATDKHGTLAGSTNLLDTIVKRLLKKNINAFKYINNVYDYHNINISGSITWDKDYNIISIEKDNHVVYNE